MNDTRQRHLHMRITVYHVINKKKMIDTPCRYTTNACYLPLPPFSIRICNSRRAPTSRDKIEKVERLIVARRERAQHVHANRRQHDTSGAHARTHACTDAITPNAYPDYGLQSHVAGKYLRHTIKRMHLPGPSRFPPFPALSSPVLVAPPARLRPTPLCRAPGGLVMMGGGRKVACVRGRSPDIPCCRNTLFRSEDVFAESEIDYHDNTGVVDNNPMLWWTETLQRTVQ